MVLISIEGIPHTAPKASQAATEPQSDRALQHKKDEGLPGKGLREGGEGLRRGLD